MADKEKQKFRGTPDPYKRRESIRNDIKNAIDKNFPGAAKDGVARLHKTSRDDDIVNTVVATTLGVLGGRFLGRRLAGASNRIEGRTNYGGNDWGRSRAERKVDRWGPDNDTGRNKVNTAGRFGGAAGGAAGYAGSSEKAKNEMRAAAARGAASARQRTRDRWRGVR